ncbi:hypothetical protein HU200_052244 [Digitaria exilis]|uniref:Ubiquitin carboxyl-terminal hydrolase n=1 Tax=Digitaria exilis TaxID=1010633 RepID=A0A835AQ63_9POAL|nr:hypothetical protein HU200_052244 [Digitaria exilis]CAB3479741.1 unnamed protein product [Digitaria exilis]
MRFFLVIPVHAMGKGEKGARAAGMDNSLRQGQAQGLNPTDPVRGDAASQRQQEYVFHDATEECEDCCFDTKEMYEFLETIKCLKADPKCTDCEAAASRKLMLCSGCSQCFCTGLVTNEDGPMGHARPHAKSACHPIALWIDQPDTAYCFECGGSLDLKLIASAARAYEPYVVRGISNRGMTCFVNVLVQCFLALRELRIWMFGPDAPKGSLGVALKNLFEKTVVGDDAGAVLDPDELLDCLGALNANYGNRTQQDSHELLLHLLDGLNEDELLKRPPGMQMDVPTVVDSIFQGQVSESLTCKCCLELVAKPPQPFYVLSLTLPPITGHPTKSTARQRSGRRARNNLKDSEEDKHKVDCLPSIKECLEDYFRKELVTRNCDSCTKDRKSSTSQGKDGGQMVASINASTSADWDQTECDRHRKAEEKSDLFSPHDDQNAHQVGENPDEQKGKHAYKALVLSKMPPVLTLHVLRFEGNAAKRLGHVKFEENLDVGKYLDLRSEDKDNTTYRLVGVVEHSGNSLHKGHYVTYVRGSRTGSEQQQSSGSSSWFYATDRIIREVPLDEVLKCDAYLLFYEQTVD